jgi:hypothetical protein
LTFLATFPKREGDREVQVSYKDYFFKRYDIRIRDLRQPLLLSRPKERDRRGGMKVISEDYMAKKIRQNAPNFLTREHFQKHG